ncbi:type 2 isopentenyl-diphosphate Delta-isomerase [Paenibacillus hemerocallicola]|uniref:Isopentenyl-diphosphate delta-isomerase n=1 Tax=Paenibacillus hemerocallicola TaxID=1172614 RepID=A0A5C4TEH5_9BACL|nr:type 2 isopentenyl-diphosphate Delta-isomerase [Paenibacillus hemerocallicola]TNJ67378.1 type 2 isopentenyl-diphosphate Delta-isomerase [Paenibacillus hemerocallicola]
MSTERRKTEHIRICLEEEVGSKTGGAGFAQYRFRHRALPEIDFGEIDTSWQWLDRDMKVPLLVSSMTGGTEEASRINRNLAEAAERRGWAMGVGSVRAALERPELSETFRIRDVAPTIPIIANIGAVQLNYGYGAAECSRAVELAEADGLVLHLNGMQELFQPEGNINFKGLLRQIEQLCSTLPIPIGIKEVGWGIDGETARLLVDAGVSFVDVAGAGGTSWSQVEKFRTTDPTRRAAAEAFADWGIPTAQCIVEARAAVPDCTLVASGGLANGVDAAKALALGANIAGYGRSLLGAGVDSADEVALVLERIEFELRAAMFGIGAADLSELRGTPLLVRPDRDWK